MIRGRGLGRWPLWLELSLLSLVIAALALGGVGALLLWNVEQRQLAQRRQGLLSQADAAAAQVSLWQRSLVTPSLSLVLYRFQQEVGVRPVFVGPDGVAVADSWDPSPVVGRHMTQPEVARALKGEQATGVRRLSDGSRVMYGVVPVRRDGAISGAVLLSADLGEVDAALADLRRQLLLAAPFAVILAVLTGSGLARYLTRPLSRLGRAAGQLAGGDLAVRVEPGGSRELVDLARSFNHMAGEIAHLDAQRRAFVADASHELRSPVAATQALAEGLLASQGDLARYRPYLEQIVQECRRSARLVDRMLELARLDARAGVGVPAVESVDVSAVVAGVVRDLQPLAAERGVALDVAASQPAQAILDPRLLETVVDNLVENGLKYTSSGGRVQVAVRVEGGEACITVSDTGCGIAEEHLPHIFERFYRVDSARSRSTGGAGLGLAIASEAARLLGGRLEVESSPGEGSTFRLRLPV